MVKYNNKLDTEDYTDFQLEFLNAVAKETLTAYWYNNEDKDLTEEAKRFIRNVEFDFTSIDEDAVNYLVSIVNRCLHMLGSSALKRPNFVEHLVHDLIYGRDIFNKPFGRPVLRETKFNDVRIYMEVLKNV